MAPASDHGHWDDDDRSLNAEHRDVVELLERHRQEIPVPGALDRRIRRLSAQRQRERLSEHWIFGQGPRVALVGIILFAIALAVLWMR